MPEHYQVLKTILNPTKEEVGSNTFVSTIKWRGLYETILFINGKAQENTLRNGPLFQIMEYHWELVNKYCGENDG